MKINIDTLIKQSLIDIENGINDFNKQQSQNGGSLRAGMPDSVTFDITQDGIPIRVTIPVGYAPWSK